MASCVHLKSVCDVSSERWWTQFYPYPELVSSSKDLGTVLALMTLPGFMKRHMSDAVVFVREPRSTYVANVRLFAGDVVLKNTSRKTNYETFNIK